MLLWQSHTYNATKISVQLEKYNLLYTIFIESKMVGSGWKVEVVVDTNAREIETIWEQCFYLE